MQVGSIPHKKFDGVVEARKEESLVDQEVKRAVLVGLGYFAPGSALETLVYVLELEHAVDFHAIGKDPKVLRAGLSAMFGKAEQVVEGKIRQALGKRLGVDSDGKSFEDLISILRSAGLGQ